MQISRSLRSLACLLTGISAPFFLTQCKTGPGTYKDVEYDSAMLNTPSGHGMEKKDYPFDDNGAYRKDWVKNNTTGKTRSASQQASLATVSADEETGSSTPAPYPTYAQASEARDAEVTGSIQNIDSATTSSASIPVSPPTSATSVSGSGSARYHTVVTGDTLFALSHRYRTTVDELKRVNGLTDDSIQKGQSLRLP
ncbi:LysM peptidoglycan-binding domain-containing protein [Verrucomicrobiales bacterium BCK34]|nr:LysM peptidoglycan-binding domain-containing protein [Verrucomicrobiales bacterium BCK34]